jgi:response regulator RpfG family c-di-GMP phosphodiesterase
MNDNADIILIDDDQRVLNGLKRTFRGVVGIQSVDSGEAAVNILQQGNTFSVAICDYQMPGMNGIATLTKFREISPSTSRVLISGQLSEDVMFQSVNEAAIHYFIKKPSGREEIENCIFSSIERFNKQEKIRRATELTTLGSIKMLSKVIGYFGIKPQVTQKHILKLLGNDVTHINGVPRWQIEVALLLSDLDKFFSIASSQNPDIDTDCEYFVSDILSSLPQMQSVADGINHKDKNFDGSGLPANITSGEHIPIIGRMLRILLEYVSMVESGSEPCDAWDKIEIAQDLFDTNLVCALKQHVIESALLNENIEL